MADTSDSNAAPTPAVVSNRICSTIPLAENLLGQNTGNPCQNLFEERTSDNYNCRVPHPMTRAINGIKNEINEKNLCAFDKMEIEFDSGLEKTVVGEGGADFSFTNGSECASDKDRGGSKGRSRRKPQYSLNKTELYEEPSDTLPPNQNITDFQMYDQNDSPEVDGNESSLYIRRSMQKIKPQYVQVPQDSAYLHEQEGGNNVQVPPSSSSILEQGVKEFTDVHSEYSSVRENHEQHAGVHQDTSSSFLQNDGYVQDSQFQNSTHEQHGEKYVDVHGGISSNLEQDSAGYVHVRQDTNSSLEQESDIETQKNQFECKECLITLFDFDLYTDHLMSHNANSQDSSSDDPSAHALDIEAPTSDFVGGSGHQSLSDSCSMESEGFLEIDLSSSKLERDENGEGRENETKMVEIMEGVMPGGDMKKKRGRKKKEREADSSLVKCPVCSKAFKTRNNLKTHLCKFHSERKEILQDFFYKGESVKQKSVCTLCRKCFISKVALLRHLDTRHQGEAQVRCGVCNEIFETTELLFKHARLCNNRGKMGSHDPNTSEENSCSVETKEKLDKNENHQTLSYVPHQIADNKTVMDPSMATLPREIQTNKGDPLLENTHLNHEVKTNHSNYINSEHVDQEGGSEEGQVEPQTSHYFQREIDVPSTDSLKSRDIYCGVCLLFFDSVEKFVVHCMASSECLSSKECPVCGKVINSSLKEHLKSHSGKYMYLKSHSGKYLKSHSSKKKFIKPL